MSERGILIACDAQIEWMVPWFIKKVRHVSELPLTLVDLGLSEEKRNRWSPFFNIIPLEIPHFELPPATEEQKNLWNRAYAGNYEIGRKARLLKPFALDLSPYTTTLWLDLDCEVLGDLTPLFAYAEKLPHLAMCPERPASLARGRSLGLLMEDEALYNSGVILYKKSALLTHWKEMTLLRGGDFIGDQELLARLLYEKNITLPELPSIYNWRMADGPSDEAAIIHWVGDGGKRHILEELLSAAVGESSTR